MMDKTKSRNGGFESRRIRFPEISRCKSMQRNVNESKTNREHSAILITFAIGSVETTSSLIGHSTHVTSTCKFAVRSIQTEILHIYASREGRKIDESRARFIGLNMAAPYIGVPKDEETKLDHSNIIFLFVA